MRIGLFTDTYFPSINGVSVSVHTLYEELITLGHEVYIFTNDHDAAVPLPHVIRFKALRPPKKALKEYRIGLFSYFKIKKVRTFDLDIIHCHSEITMGRIARKVAKLDGIPFVYTYHTMYEDYTHFISKRGTNALKRFFKWVALFYANFAQGVIFPTEKVAQTFLGYGFKNPYHIIPTGIDLEDFKQLSDSTFKTQIQTQYQKPFPHGIFVGRLSHEKNIQALLTSVKHLNDQGIPMHLTMIGDGPERARYERFCQTENLTDQVTFVGMVPHEEVAYYYHMADFFVSFSKTETQGLTTIEALASGLPAMAMEDVHLKAWIQPMKNGVLFSNAKAFEALVKKMHGSGPIFAYSRDEIMESVQALDKKLYGQNVLMLYQSLIKKRPDHI